jgi:ketosteroid isomerase-like protein
VRNDELAKALFDGFGKGDADSVRQLCTADFEARQNGGPALTLEPLIEFALAVYQVVKDFRYEDAVRSETDRGFVEEHSVRGTLPDGSELDLAVCVVADVRDGKVSNVREYFDSASAAELIKLLS